MIFALIKKRATDLIWHIAPPEFKRLDGSEEPLCPMPRFIPAVSQPFSRHVLTLNQQVCEKCVQEYLTALPELERRGRNQWK